MTTNRAQRRIATSLERRGEATTPEAIWAILNTKEAAEYVRLSKPTLERFRISGYGPVFLKLGGAVRYRREDLDSWLESRVARSTSEVGA